MMKTNGGASPNKTWKKTAPTPLGGPARSLIEDKKRIRATTVFQSARLGKLTTETAGATTWCRRSIASVCNRKAELRRALDFLLQETTEVQRAVGSARFSTHD